MQPKTWHPSNITGPRTSAFIFPVFQNKAPLLPCSLQLLEDVNILLPIETITSLYSAHKGLKQAELQHFISRLSVLP